jgi:hypothetical protein
LSLLRYTPSREEMVNRQDFFRFDRLYFFHAQSREEKSQLPHDFLAAEGGGPIIRAPALSVCERQFDRWRRAYSERWFAQAFCEDRIGFAQRRVGTNQSFRIIEGTKW